MPSTLVIVTAIESAFGLALNCAILYLVLRRGRQAHSRIFAILLFTYIIWDLTVLLTMLRNQHVNELPIYAYLQLFPGVTIQALIFTFTVVYLRKPMRWSILLVWAMTAGSIVLILLGLVCKVSGVHSYPWGNMFRYEPSPLDPAVFIFWFGMILPACWLLYKHSRIASKALERRHARYVMIGFLVTAFSIFKVLLPMGYNISFLLPLGMFLNDAFAAVIGLAIIKERLFDITVIIKKSTLYSALAAVALFVFSLSEHVLITYLGELVGGHSEIIYIISIALGIAAMMPVKRRIEHAIDRYFARRKLEF